MTTEPTHCADCADSLDRGYSSRYAENGTLLRSICFDCARQERVAEYEKTGIITTRSMVEAAIDRERGHPSKLANETASIQVHVREFERRTWFGADGIRAHLDKHMERGERLDHGDLCLLTYVMAGRIMITMESPEASLTLITTDEKDETPRMGIQGISATEGQAHGLLEMAEAAWARGARTVPDAKVGMF